MLTKEIIHELNNSFTVCKGYLKMLNQNKYQSILTEEINKCIALINKEEENKKFFIVNDLILELKEYYEYTYNICINYHKCHYSFYGNYSKIKDMFINLIKNSIEADAIKIDIKVLEKNNNLIIIFTDDGQGIKKDFLNKLNKINISNKSKGHGIGLKSIKDTIKNHNGSLDIKSTYHYGTTFIIKFPI